VAAAALELPEWSSNTPSLSLKVVGVPEKVPGVDIARLNLTPFEGYLLSMVDGHTSTDDLVAASGLGKVDAAAALTRMVELGALVLRSVPVARAGATGNTAVAHVALKRISAPGFNTLDVEGTLARVRQARAAGDLAGARELLKAAQRMAPDHDDIPPLREELEGPHHAKERARELVRLGVKAERTGSMASAVTFYQRALMEFEPSAVLHHRTALCMLHAGLAPTQALPHARRASELAPADVRYTQLFARLQTWRS
jgi:hypothetical protein